MSLDPEVLKQIAVGDKVEVHDTKNDRVTQGWVEQFRRWPMVEKHITGKNAGEYCYGEIVFKGDSDGYAYHVFVDDEVRILVKKPEPLTVGKSISHPFANDLPLGMILQRQVSSAQTVGAMWVVVRNGASDTKRFVSLNDYRRTHDRLSNLYKIVGMLDE